MIIRESGGETATAADTAAAPAMATAQGEDSARAGERSAEAERLQRVGLLCPIHTGSVAEPADPFRATGAHVAASALPQALALRGGVARLDIFGQFSTVERARRQFARSAPSSPDATMPAVRFLPESALPDALRSLRYDALHDVSTELLRASYIRSRFSGRVFPVTSSQYAISYGFDLFAVFVSLLTAQIYPCDAIVCLSRDARRAMEKRLADISERYTRAWRQQVPPLPRLELIPLGIETDRFAERDSRNARADLGLPQDRPIVLCVGRVRIHDKMDWTPLLLMFRRVLRGPGPAPLLVIAGSVYSDYGDYLVSQVSRLGLGEHVRTLFSLPQASMPSLYAASDLFVSPTDTLSESFGLTILEAMACGRPVVASDWDGYKDLIVHGETGFRVRTHWADCFAELDEISPCIAWEQTHLHMGQSVSVDVPEMARYVSLLLGNPELRRKMGQAGRKRAVALYDWTAITAQWEALWVELGAIAQGLQREHCDRMDYLRPHYFQHFSHYPSRIIRDATPVRLTEAGRDLLSGAVPLLLYPGATGFLDPQYLRAGLAALRPAAWLKTSVPAGSLADALQKRCNLSRERAYLHIMWLAKYDLIHLGEDASAPAASEPVS